MADERLPEWLIRYIESIWRYLELVECQVLHPLAQVYVFGVRLLVWQLAEPGAFKNPRKVRSLRKRIDTSVVVLWFLANEG